MNEQLRHLRNAAKYSLDGLKFMFSETSFRQELTMIALSVLAVGLLKGCGALSALLSPAALVLTCESLNSAVEAVVDLCTKEIHPLAKKAKDTASFACAFTNIVFLIRTCLVIMGL